MRWRDDGPRRPDLFALAVRWVYLNGRQVGEDVLALVVFVLVMIALGLLLLLIAAARDPRFVM